MQNTLTLQYVPTTKPVEVRLHLGAGPGEDCT